MLTASSTNKVTLIQGSSVYLQHGALRVGGSGEVDHLLHLVPGTVRVLPKDHMVVPGAGG